MMSPNCMLPHMLCPCHVNPVSSHAISNNAGRPPHHPQPFSLSIPKPRHLKRPFCMRQFRSIFTPNPAHTPYPSNYSPLFYPAHRFVLLSLFTSHTSDPVRQRSSHPIMFQCIRSVTQNLVHYSMLTCFTTGLTWHGHSMWGNIQFGDIIAYT